MFLKSIMGSQVELLEGDQLMGVQYSISPLISTVNWVSTVVSVGDEFTEEETSTLGVGSTNQQVCDVARIKRKKRKNSCLFPTMP